MSNTELQQFKAQLATTPPVECDLKVGDNVIVTNGYGIEFKRKVIGFSHKIQANKGFIYLDWDCYWMPKRLDDVRKY